jgi:hypothetical protein
MIRLAVNPAMDARNIRRLPNRVLSQPEIAIITVLPMMKAVMIQAISSGVAEKAPCIRGNATPAIVQVNS